MNHPDPELQPWQQSLKKDFLLECPKCHYKFADTLSLVGGSNGGLIQCRRCDQHIQWEERIQRTYICKAV